MNTLSKLIKAKEEYERVLVQYEREQAEKERETFVPCRKCKTQNVWKRSKDGGPGFDYRYWVECKKCGNSSQWYIGEGPDKYTKHWNEENALSGFTDVFGQELRVNDKILLFDSQSVAKAKIIKLEKNANSTVFVEIYTKAKNSKTVTSDVTYGGTKGVCSRIVKVDWSKFEETL